jgi:hypothetical protein
MYAHTKGQYTKVINGHCCVDHVGHTLLETNAKKGHDVIHERTTNAKHTFTKLVQHIENTSWHPISGHLIVTIQKASD